MSFPPHSKSFCRQQLSLFIVALEAVYNFLSIPFTVIRPRVMFDWSELVVEWTDTVRNVGMMIVVIWLAGIEIKIVLHWNVRFMGCVVGNWDMLSWWISRWRIWEVWQARNIIEVLMWTGSCWWRLRCEIVLGWIMLSKHHLRCRTRVDSRWIHLIITIHPGPRFPIVNFLILSGFSPYPVRFNIRIKCDFFVIFQFQSTQWCLRCFRHWIKYRCFCCVARYVWCWSDGVG